LRRSGELDERAGRFYEILKSCTLCPRKCRVNRAAGKEGYCRSGIELRVSSYGPHFGEEPEISGSDGSGTIFLTGCNLLCVYCQNYEISHFGAGKQVSTEETAQMMLELQSVGCHNINLVTPTHYAPQLVKTISAAAEKGLRIPIFWNCSGYENVEAIRNLEGIVDIFKADMKYGETEPARKYSNAPDYFERCKEAVREMYRQVGDLKVDNRGIAHKGLLIRHLVLPNNLAGSKKIPDFLADLSKECYVNIMAQYRPCGTAREHEELRRRITSDEYRRALEYAKKLGLHRGFTNPR
jgi:putative pyruvate formate lyase activating enzyme